MLLLKYHKQYTRSRVSKDVSGFSPPARRSHLEGVPPDHIDCLWLISVDREGLGS